MNIEDSKKSINKENNMNEEVEADGYYGDDAETDELDLSFLDDEDEDE